MCVAGYTSQVFTMKSKVLHEPEGAETVSVLDLHCGCLYFKALALWVAVIYIVLCVGVFLHAHESGLAFKAFKISHCL